MRLLFILLLTTFMLPAIADKWAPPELQSTISPNSSIVVRIIPGEGFVESNNVSHVNEPNARAKYFKWIEPFGYELYQDIELTNPAAPLHVFIFNDGTLITIDNWYSKGSGKVIVIYSPNGDLLKSYSLSELFPNESDYHALPRSVSSIHWRCAKPHIWLNSVLVPHALGGRFVVDPKTGHIENIKTDKKCK